MIERALLVNGTTGVGKTTVAEAVAHLLAERGEPHAWIDLDALSESWPAPSDDPFNARVVAANVACTSANFAEAGARTLVLAGVVETRDQFQAYEQAVGCTLTVVRLTAPLPEVARRLRRRHGADDRGSLAWHLERAPELDASLERSQLPMAVVTATAPVAVVAAAVLDAAGW